MAGLLDLTDDPRQAGLLALGLGLLGSRGSFGQGLSQAGGQALQAMQQARMNQQQQQDRTRAQQMQALQMQQVQMQLAEAQKKQAEQEKLRTLAQQFARPPGQMAMAGGGGPSVANAQAAQTAAPGFDYQGYANALAGVDPMASLQFKAALQKDAPKRTVVSPGGVLVDEATGKPIYTAPDKPEKDPEAIRALKAIYGDGTPAYLSALAKLGQKMTTHQPGVNVSYGAPVAGVDAKGNPVFFQPDKGGGAPAIVPGVAPPKSDKPMTEAQAKAATFMSQMKAAEQELSVLPLDMSKIWNQADVGIAGGVGNVAASPIAQRARQAQDQWSESFLRFKTGAAATQEEVRLNSRTFFPQPGDSKEVIAQKKRMRDQAIQDIGVAASGNPPDHSAGKPGAGANDPLGLRGGK